jgi:hypothetical protein
MMARMLAGEWPDLEALVLRRAHATLEADPDPILAPDEGEETGSALDDSSPEDPEGFDGSTGFGAEEDLS